MNETNAQHDARRLRWQIIVFCLSWISYCSVHMQREMWSVSKPQITHNPKYSLTEDQLSDVDTVNFFVYGLS